LTGNVSLVISKELSGTMTGCSHADNVWRIVESIKICMLTTMASGRLRSRPMHAVPDKDQGCLWFITDQRGAKDEEIQAAPEVCLAFADTRSLSQHDWPRRNVERFFQGSQLVER
jgi:general stress protein 26